MAATEVRVSIVAALDSQRLIGSGASLPWRLPADMRRFRKLTMGKPVVMGRKTFQSIGRVLDGRVNVVITRDTRFCGGGAMVAHSIVDAMSRLGGESEVMIIGGASIYAQTLPMADRMYLTFIHQAFEGDSYFPDYDPREWMETAREVHPPGAEASFGFTYSTLDRIRRSFIDDRRRR